MSKKHRVKLHKWVNGQLDTIAAAFDSLAEAMEFVNNGDHHAAKIYNESGNLVHSVQSVNPEPPILPQTDSYA
jgi:hypothetical protein